MIAVCSLAIACAVAQPIPMHACSYAPSCRSAIFPLHAMRAAGRGATNAVEPYGEQGALLAQGCTLVGQSVVAGAACCSRGMNGWMASNKRKAVQLASHALLGTIEMCRC